jgi:hypothetical protein
VTEKVPYFVELCAGSAAVSLALVGGCRPPTTWMGGKSRYASAILRVLGLRRGQGAAGLLLAEAGPWADVWRVLADRGNRQRVADLLDCYADPDDQAVWDRLHAEWRQDESVTTAESCARWLWLTDRSFGGKGPAAGFDHHHRGGSGRRLARQVTILPPFPARTVVLRTDVAALVPRVPLPAGTLVYIDPPYFGTSGYRGVSLGRSQVLGVARRWADAGATVCLSEAEPLPLGAGWHHVELTGCRRGKRTFSVQQREWLTISRALAWVPAADQEPDWFDQFFEHPVAHQPAT